ncbi:MAG: hypothetical protein AAGF12_05045 [Myxococcota bacterium]
MAFGKYSCAFLVLVAGFGCGDDTSEPTPMPDGGGSSCPLISGAYSISVTDMGPTTTDCGVAGGMSADLTVTQAGCSVQYALPTGGEALACTADSSGRCVAMSQGVTATAVFSGSAVTVVVEGSGLSCTFGGPKQ